MADSQVNVDLVVRLKNLEKALNEIKSKVGAIKLPDFKFSAQSAQAYTQFIRAMGQSGPQFQAAARNINAFTASIAGSTAALNKAAPGLKAMASALNAVSNHSRAASKGTGEVVGKMEDLGRQTAITIRRFGGFLIARDLVFGLGFAFKNAVGEAIKFERELTKIAQLQETSIASARELGKFIGDLAIKFGASSSELAQSAQVLAQAGKKTGEIKSILKTLGEASLIPTFDNLTKSSDSLLAVLGQFNLKGQDAAATFDILNSVSKEFNVSVDELFEGVRRAGSTFATLSGITKLSGSQEGLKALKEFAALFTAVIDTSRESAESIGTAFRTILPRLLRGDTRELLKKELGLDLLDDSEQFIGPFKAIEGLFKSLQKFKGTDASFIKIIETLGGSRQVGRAIPLIQEFPKAQRALEIANKSSGSVAKDTTLAYQTLSVQLAQIKEQFLALGRDLVASGTFRTFADTFLSVAKAASILVKAIEPLLPLIGGLVALSSARGLLSFGKGFFFDKAFSLGPVKRASGGNIDRVDALLTPGELVLSPESAKMNGQAALRRFNSTGDIGALKTLKGAQMVPGTGNSDSVAAKLEPGSFVIRKRSVQKALGFKKFASGGRVGMAQGDFALSPSLGELDAATTASLTKYGRELKFLGENTKSINNLFKSILSSSRDLPTALTRIATEISRSYPASNPNLPGGGVNSGSLSIPVRAAVDQARYGFSANFVSMQDLQQSANAIAAQTPRGVIPMAGPQSGPTIYAKSQGMIDFEDQLRSGQGVSRYSVTSADNPGFRSRPSLRDRAGAAIDNIINKSKSAITYGGELLDRGNDLVAQSPQMAAQAAKRGGTYLATQSRAAYIQSKRGLLRLKGGLTQGQFTQGGASALGFASLGATVAGGTILSKANSGGAAGFGGALSGAGVGAGLGASFGPLGAALGGLTGAVFGAVSAFKNFNQEAERFKTENVVEGFVTGRRGGSLGSVASRLGEVGTGFRSDVAGAGNSLSRLVAGNDVNFGATSRAGLLSNLKATLSAGLSSATFGTVGNKNAITDLAGNQISTETAALQAQFGPASEKVAQTLQEDIIKKIQRGENVNANDIAQKLSPDQLRLLAVNNPAFKSSDLADENKIRNLGFGAAVKLAKEQIDASKAAADLSKIMTSLARSTVLLEDSFKQIDARLRESEVTFANFDNQVQSILDPSKQSVNSRFNVFSNVEGIQTSRVAGEINAIEGKFGLGNTAAGDAALFAAQIKNGLPRLLAEGAGTNPTKGIGDFLRDTLGNANFDPSVMNLLNDTISSIGVGEETLSSLDPQKAQQLTEQLVNGFEPALKIFEKVANLQEANARREAELLNQRAQIEGKISDQSLEINAIGYQRQDLGTQLLGLPGPGPEVVRGRVARDLATLGVEPGAGAPINILGEINRIQEGGVSADEATKYNNLVKALELLSNDTRILDATIQKNNRLEEARQGARSISERILSGGNDEIAKINREARDFQILRGGGSLPTLQRTEAALRTGSQLTAGVSQEQFERFGIGSKQDYLNNIENIRSVQTGGRVEGGTYRDILMENLRARNPETDPIVREARGAISTQQQAMEVLRSMDEKRVQDLNTALQEQSVIFAGEIQKAFASEPVQDFVTAAKTLSDGATLKLDGTVQVAVSFNNVDGAMKNIQEDLRGFVGKVVDEQIKKALNMPQVAAANTA